MSDFATLEEAFKGNADNMRLRALKRLSSLTKRNTIAYYSGFLTPGPVRNGFEISDLDINAFMNMAHGMDRSRGLNLILHTPGGGIAATEQIVTYLRSLFDGDIVCFVPQIAMSAGTMIACACQSIFMGRQSCLGPIDPQYLGCPCHGVIEEFERAVDRIKKDITELHLWRPIIEKYNPTFLGECQKAIELSKELVGQWLATGMFKDEEYPQKKAEEVAGRLADHSRTKTHNRHISAEVAKSLGLHIEMLEDQQNLQDAVLAVHHCFMLSFMHSPLIKIVQAQNGKRFLISATAG